MIPAGKRTLFFGMASLAALLVAFALIPDKDRGAAYVFFAGGVGALIAAIAGKSAVESLAQGTGIRGATATLMTSKKPGEA